MLKTSKILQSFGLSTEVMIRKYAVQIVAYVEILEEACRSIEQLDNEHRSRTGAELPYHICKLVCALVDILVQFCLE